jgi:hypothetical protein
LRVETLVLGTAVLLGMTHNFVLINVGRATSSVAAAAAIALLLVAPITLRALVTTLLLPVAVVSRRFTTAIPLLGSVTSSFASMMTLMMAGWFVSVSSTLAAASVSPAFTAASITTALAAFVASALATATITTALAASVTALLATRRSAVATALALAVIVALALIIIVVTASATAAVLASSLVVVRHAECGLSGCSGCSRETLHEWYD